MSGEEIINFYSSQVSDIFVEAFNLLYVLGPYWIPPFLAVWFYSLWRRYVQAKYRLDREWVLLEIKLPLEIQKSPKAMEIVMTIFHQTWQSNWFRRLVEGISRTWFSLELVSLEGRVHFFIRTPFQLLSTPLSETLSAAQTIPNRYHTQ